MVHRTRKPPPDCDLTNEDPRRSQIDWPYEYSFKDALFAARSNPNDAKQWARIFGAEIHTYPRPHQNMSDEAYAAWVREIVYRHVLEKNSPKQKRQFHRREGRQYGGRMEPERDRRLQEPSQRWRDYLSALQPPQSDGNQDLLLLWQRSDVPWPTPSGRKKDISEENIRRFIEKYVLEYSQTAGQNWKRAVRQTQSYWHPDKFRQHQHTKLVRLEPDQVQEIMAGVTEVSAILNKLANEDGRDEFN
jgi:hypothetical protein